MLRKSSIILTAVLLVAGSASFSAAQQGSGSDLKFGTGLLAYNSPIGSQMVGKVVLGLSQVDIEFGTALNTGAGRTDFGLVAGVAFFPVQMSGSKMGFGLDFGLGTISANNNSTTIFLVGLFGEFKVTPVDALDIGVRFYPFLLSSGGGATRVGILNPGLSIVVFF